MKTRAATFLVFAAALTACTEAVEIPAQSDKPFTPEAAQPGTPPHAPARVEWDESSGALRLSYGGRVILDGRLVGSGVKLVNAVSTGQGLDQRLTISGANLALRADVSGSEQMLAAETAGEAQKKFPMIRTSHGMSGNLRNNAVYDRKWDWELVAETGVARITPGMETPEAREFRFAVSGDRIELVFRPSFYRKHKGVAFFEPWKRKVREDSITGWSSWWAFTRKFSQKDCDALLAVWKEKRMADYGYRFIQIDDCFQDDLRPGAGYQQHPVTNGKNSGYHCRGPETWLDWRKDFYPSGMQGYVAACKNAGFEPGVWIGNYFTGKALIEKHPDWFVHDAKGNLFAAPWASCGIDATNKEAMDTLVRPTYRGVREAGFPYVKIDLMRHYLYDNLHKNTAYCKERGVTPAQMYRKYLSAAREELGEDTFLLSCWGVLPESVGIADACRIAGDGYGPASMQQYNAWNGIVWRNDPDHCDVFPKFKPAEVGNVTKTEAVKAANNDTIIRPALASISGSMLLLSDKPEVYRDDRNIEGAKRSSPVLFSVPGQLYDFDDRHSRTLLTTARESIQYGGNPVSCDADQFGKVCPWWLNEFNIAGVGSWSVLHRVNWGGKAPAVTVNFADLGLDPKADHLVYEFWTQKFLGVCRGSLDLPEAGEHELRSYALRPLENRPQVVSTNRHLSQGGADLLEVKWAGRTLSGRSKAVAADRYEIAVHAPAGFTAKSAEIAEKPARIIKEGDLLRLSFVPETTGETSWSVSFE
jgi:hypothetical protein